MSTKARLDKLERRKAAQAESVIIAHEYPDTPGMVEVNGEQMTLAELHARYDNSGAIVFLIAREVSKELTDLL